MNCQCSSNGQNSRNLVYLNKVYFDETQESSPILYALTSTPETFTQQLTFGQSRSSGCSCGSGCSGCGCGGCGCGCGCCDFAVNAATTFRITDSRVVVTGFTLSEDAEFDDEDVTVDGFSVTELALVNGQYVADLSGIMSEITDCPCSPEISRCSCASDSRCSLDCDNDGHFFLAQVPGPWAAGLAIILEGTASNGSRTCSFKLCLRTIPGEEDAGIVIPGSDSFAVYCVEIPCQTAGISPSLVFDFDACAALLNPALTVTCEEEEGCRVTLSATLVLTPEINLKVTKPALFNLNATEITQDCDNVGQCDLCDPDESCCCGTNGRTGQRSERSERNEQGERSQRCQETRSRSAACQCCETNGYSF